MEATRFQLFVHFFGKHTPDMDSVYYYGGHRHADCVVCGEDLTESYPWED